MPGTEQRELPILTVTAPAIGSPIFIPVTSPAPWRIMLIKCRFVTSATVANRTIFVALLNSDGNVISRFPQGAVIAASATVSCTWAVGYNVLNTLDPGNFCGPLPDITIP